MSVYTDSLRPCIPNPRWRWGSNAHLVADSIAELDAFARAIGLKPAWRQVSSNGMPHYDLTPAKHAEAITAGAILLDARRFVNFLRAFRGLPPLPDSDPVPPAAPPRPVMPPVYFLDPLSRCGKSPDFPTAQCCRLTAVSVRDLDDLARKISAPRRNYGKLPNGIPFYRLNEPQRRGAVQAGAVEQTARDFLLTILEFSA